MMTGREPLMMWFVVVVPNQCVRACLLCCLTITASICYYTYYYYHRSRQIFRGGAYIIHTTWLSATTLLAPKDRAVHTIYCCWCMARQVGLIWFDLIFVFSYDMVRSTPPPEYAFVRTAPPIYVFCDTWWWWWPSCCQDDFPQQQQQPHARKFYQ